MTDILRRSMAPISDKAWAEIDAQAQRTLKGNLSARKVVDFSGPHGLELGAVNLGLLKIPEGDNARTAPWGLRQVLPLVEVRMPFTLKIWELDNVDRGAKAPELDTLIAAARKISIFEESAVYKGLPDAGIKGLIEAAGPKPIALPKTAQGFVAAVETGIVALQKAGIGGPYALVLGTVPYEILMAGCDPGYPIIKKVKSLIESGIAWSPVLEGGLILSRRGGDFEFTCGQDLAIGYKAHSATEVELYLTESFTFRVLEPNAVVELKLKG